MDPFKPKHLFSAIVVSFAMSTTAGAEVINCEIDRVVGKAKTSNSDENTIGSLGQAFRVDTSKNLVQIQYKEGTTKWETPSRVTKNSSFTAYIFVLDRNVTDTNSVSSKTIQTTLSYRLYVDKTGAEARSDVKNYYPLSARYTCE